MSDPDDSVIEQLQARRSRPRRQPPIRHASQAAAADPASRMDERKTDAGSAKPDPDEAPIPFAPKDSGGPSLSTDPKTSLAATPANEQAAGRRTFKASAVHTAASAEGLSAGQLRLDSDEPTANYAVRVRRSLDDLVAWRLAELRRHGARASKVELTEMLLWELVDADVDDLIGRLGRFRSHAPRQ